MHLFLPAYFVHKCNLQTSHYSISNVVYMFMGNAKYFFCSSWITDVFPAFNAFLRTAQSQQLNIRSKLEFVNSTGILVRYSNLGIFLSPLQQNANWGEILSVIAFNYDFTKYFGANQITQFFFLNMYCELFNSI